MTIRSTGTRRPTPGIRSRRFGSYPGGQTTPSPHALDFNPGELLGSVSGELGLRGFLEAAGQTRPQLPSTIK